MATPVSQPVSSASFFLADTFVPGDRGVGFRLDDAILLQSLPVWPSVKANSGDTKLIWYETPTSFPGMALSATASAAATTFNVVANYARVGDVLEVLNVTAGTYEYALVTAVSSKALTVTRSYNGSTAAICSATGSSIVIAGNVNVEKATFTSGVSVAQNELYNYNQISHESYELSGSAAGGMLQDGSTPMDPEQLKAFIRLRGRINRSLYHNASATQMTTSAYGMAKGIRGWLTTNDYAITSSDIGGTTTSTSLSWAKLNAFLWKLKQAGGSDQVTIVAGANAFNAIKLALDGYSTKFQNVGFIGGGGGYVGGFISMFGQQVNCAYDKYLPTGVLVAHDSGQPGTTGIYFSPVIGRELVDIPITGRIDMKGSDILTEWTIMVLNEATSGYITGITTGG